MAFPQTPLEVTVELAPGTDLSAGLGTWIFEDITPHALTRDGISIRRGRPDEAGQAEPSTCTLTLNNRDGRYSPRNPVSPLYGLIGRNTPLRVSVGEPHVGAADGSTTASTSHVAPSVTAATAGLLLCAWAGGLAAESYTIAVGMTAGPAQTHGRSTMASASQAVSAGATGTRTATVTTATAWEAASVLLHGATPAVQQTLSGVANTAAGNDVTLTTAATTETGWWLVAVQHWDYVSEARTRFMPDAPQDGEGGWIPLADSGIVDVGSVFREQLRMWARRVKRAGVQQVTFFGISGLNAANDAHLFVLSGVDVWSPRATVEVSAWPQRWDVSGNDVWVPLAGAGIMRRLGQGQTPLYSAIRRATTGELVAGIDFGTSGRRTGLPVAYWPLEDGSVATTAASGLDGGAPMQVSFGPVEFARTAGPGGSDMLPDMVSNSGGGLTGPVPATVPDSSDSWTITFVVNFAGTGVWPVLTVNVDSTFVMVDMELSASISLFGTNAAGTVTTIGTLSNPEHNLSDGAWYHVKLEAFVSGANTVYTMTVHNEDGSERFVGNQVGNPVAGGGNPGPVVSVMVRRWAFGGSQASVGHLAVYAEEYDEQDLLVVPAVDGHTDETAGRRIERLCGEEQIPFHPVGVLDDTAAMGPQKVDTLLNLLHQCETADLGILYEPRETLGLAYRTRRSLYNQAATLALTYGAAGEVAPPLEPTPDDQATRNDVTVTRAGATGVGGSARATQTTGPLSVDAIGRYPADRQVNVGSDLALPDQAGWRLHLGTVDEDRYPTIRVNAAALGNAGKTTLLDQAAAMDVGDRLSIGSPPLWLPPEQITQLAQGLSETLGQYEWDVAVNASPESPVHIAEVAHTLYLMLGSDSSTLSAAFVAGTGTQMQVAVGAGRPLWVHETNFDVFAGGVRLTVTAVASVVLDTFTRSVSNGWGTSDSGQAWTKLAGGAAADFSVDGSRGVILLPTGDTTSRSMVLPDVFATADVRVTMRVSAVATGANLNGYIRFRNVDANNYYRLWVAFDTGGNVDLAIQVVVAGTGTTLVSAANVVTYGAGSDVHARVQAIGTSLRGKVWTGTVEPAAWTLTITDSTYTSGQVGVRAVQSTGNTNTNPTVDFDNFEATNPQTFTVTQTPVNAVAKTIPAGTVVDLFHKIYIGL